MKDTTKGGAVILWIGWILAAIVAGGPFLQYVILGICRAPWCRTFAVYFGDGAGRVLVPAIWFC